MPYRCWILFCFYQILNINFPLSAVRAGAGGDEAGIWAGDLVGRCFFVLSNLLEIKHFHLHVIVKCKRSEWILLKKFWQPFFHHSPLSNGCHISPRLFL